MKIVLLTSLPPNMSLLSSPKPRLRHGRQHVRLSHTSDPKSVYSLLRSLTGSSSSSSPDFPNCSSPMGSASTYANYLISQFSVSQPKALRSRTRNYLSELRRATCPEKSHSSFCSLFSLLNFSRLPQISPRPLPLAQTKLPILC